MAREINIIRTETWLNDDFDSIHAILEQAIKDFIEEDDRIINIQMVKDSSGLSRFWIYVESGK
jgi:hypothetical protein